jgi:outer membrane immunogenic protein
MRLFNKLALAIAMGVALTGASVAADSIAYSTSTAAQVPVHDDVPFDWNGFYAGLYGAGRTSPVQGDQFGVGVNAGINLAFDFYLVGAEVALEGLTGDQGDTSYADVLARGGLLVTDDVLVYAAAGYGVDTGAPDETDFLLGAGAEFAVTDNVSIRAQYLHGFPVTGENGKDQVTFGANFHF